MSALQQIDVTPLCEELTAVDIRSKISAIFWLWFYSHQDERVTTVKVWFISKTLYVRDLRSIFILLFGPEL